MQHLFQGFSFCSSCLTIHGPTSKYLLTTASTAIGTAIASSQIILQIMSTAYASSAAYHNEPGDDAIPKDVSPIIVTTILPAAHVTQDEGYIVHDLTKYGFGDFFFKSGPRSGWVGQDWQRNTRHDHSQSGVWKVSNSNTPLFTRSLNQHVQDVLQRGYVYMIKDALFWSLYGLRIILKMRPSTVLTQAAKNPEHFKQKWGRIVFPCLHTSVDDCGNCVSEPVWEMPRCMSACSGSHTRCKRHAPERSYIDFKNYMGPPDTILQWSFCKQHAEMFQGLDMSQGPIPLPVCKYLVKCFEEKQMEPFAELVQGTAKWEWLLKQWPTTGQQVHHPNLVDILAQAPMQMYRYAATLAMQDHMAFDVAGVSSSYM
jgi:hypothetical protein